MTPVCETATAQELELALEFGFEGDFCWIAHGVSKLLGDEPGDTMEHLTRSRVIVTEDNSPLQEGHAPHQLIRSLGRGRYSHWEDCVRFATSDNSSAFTNGRVYELIAGHRRVRLNPSSTNPDWTAFVNRNLAKRRAQVSDVDVWLQHDARFSWFVYLDELCRRYRLSAPLNPDAITIREDGRELVRAAAAADFVREIGAGSFCVEWPRLFFSASDNTNPKLNGHRYELDLEGSRVEIPASPQAIVLGSQTSPMAADLVQLVRAAVQTGVETVFELPYQVDYFRFLAGLMRVRGYTRVLEIGTERGYSAASIASGMGNAIDTLVTCDFGDTAPILNDRVGVHRVIGDVMGQANIRRILDLFGRQPIDVLFVDSGHDYPTTMAHMGTFATLLQPQLILIDDIVLNEDMARFWSDVRAMYGNRAVNACDIDPRVRQGDCGFGIVAPGSLL